MCGSFHPCGKELNEAVLSLPKTGPGWHLRRGPQEGSLCELIRPTGHTLHRQPTAADMCFFQEKRCNFSRSQAEVVHMATLIIT